MRFFPVTCALVILAFPANSEPDSATSRCLQLNRLLAVLPAPGDLGPAAGACGQYQDVLRSGDSAKISESLRTATAALDGAGLTEAALFTRMDNAAASLTGARRFYALADLAKDALRAGQLEKAQDFARELLQQAPQYKKDWNFGNAIYYGYFVLGRIALQQGNLKLASHYLLDSASTPGSPQLNSFGPNVTLAKELLEKGQSGAVLQYLAGVRTFWKSDRGKLDQWVAAIRAGDTPDFGPNLNY